MDTFHTETESRGRTVPLIRQASGFVVTLTAGKGYYQHPYCDDWSEARSLYLEPPSGWTVVGVSACDETGQPFAKLTAWDMAQLRSGR